MDNDEIVAYIVIGEERVFVIGLGCATERDEEMGIPFPWKDFVNVGNMLFCDDCGRELMHCYDSRLWGMNF